MYQRTPVIHKIIAMYTHGAQNNILFINACERARRWRPRTGTSVCAYRVCRRPRSVTARPSAAAARRQCLLAVWPPQCSCKMPLCPSGRRRVLFYRTTDSHNSRTSCSSASLVHYQPQQQSQSLQCVEIWLRRRLSAAAAPPLPTTPPTTVRRRSPPATRLWPPPPQQLQLLQRRLLMYGQTPGTVTNSAKSSVNYSCPIINAYMINSCSITRLLSCVCVPNGFS